jgi:alpha-galactosidase
MGNSQTLPASGATGAKQVRGNATSIAVHDDGTYSILSQDSAREILRSDMEADTGSGVLRSTDYPEHVKTITAFTNEFGSGQLTTIRHKGRPGSPELISEFRSYDGRNWIELRLRIQNTTKAPIELHTFRLVGGAASTVPNLDGPVFEDRILSDSFSEDHPQLRIMDAMEPAGGLHRGFGSQLIYNRHSKQSLFVGALTADRFLTIVNLRTSPDARCDAYRVEQTGTTEALADQSENPSHDALSLRLKVPTGEELGSERVLIAAGPDYHVQLEDYGTAVRELHRPALSFPTPMGWWSWTAYYYGITEPTTLTNADWLAQNLKSIGYRYFQVDEGYQFARGEYATADRTAFPRGMVRVGEEVRAKGLTFGLWVAPFQVSERSWVFEHHPDWLVHNAAGEPLGIGKVGGRFDRLFALDTTQPGAQAYLCDTYRTLVNDWGARFLKLDFMDSSSVEGEHYRPNTTALEALKIGLQVIRFAVGDDVILDKDGSPMLTPVGIVNAGRISQDTGHTFQSTRDAASGVAARYYMNRNFYVADPDAFTVSEQTIPDRGWHGNSVPLTLEEAEASIALSALSGGMFEIGDDLPALGRSPERLALVRNQDLIDMVQLGHSAVPVDLMSYRTEDEQPSIFLLKEDRRQSILAVFNWTGQPRSHTFSAEQMGIQASARYAATDVFRGTELAIRNNRISISQPPHSVRLIKIELASVPVAAPRIAVRMASNATAGTSVQFEAVQEGTDTPVLDCHWEFGDGVVADGMAAVHAFTAAGVYKVKVTARGLGRRSATKSLQIPISGRVPTVYDSSLKQRHQDPSR